MRLQPKLAALLRTSSLVLRPDDLLAYSPMRQLGVCTENRNNPKLTHGAVRSLTVWVQTIHAVTVLVILLSLFPRALSAAQRFCPSKRRIGPG